jgi:hypothetical protein
MILSRRQFVSALPLALLAGVALAPVGCGGDEGVRKYDTPKTTEPGPKIGPTASGDYRLLGLMVPADDPQWFFKYNGPADHLTKYEADFDKLAASIQLVGGAPDYTPPAGWKKGPGRDGFVKVFGTVITDDGKQEVSITQSAGGVGMNLSRWVGQIGLKSGADDEAKYTTVIDGRGVKVRRVDLRGPQDPATKRGPMMGGGMPAGHP